MPSTYNGIGTHYYGKKNLSTRTAACRSCRRAGILASYDTRLYVVVFFIPIIPLGRKRVIDACPACSRHYAADAAKFEQARQLQTSGSLDAFRRDPSPRAAIEIHAGLLAFHEHDRAAEFREAALRAFPDHAGLRAGLASQLDEVLEYGRASTLYDDALALDPGLPEARAGVALRRIHAGDLDEARDLLDFLEAPGAGQVHALGPLETLARAYQAANRHDEALELADCLLREFPAAGQMHAFRSLVAKSERAIRRPESILPRREHSLGGLFRKSGSNYAPWMRNAVLAGLAATLLAAGLAINNVYIRDHRTVHVVNATGGTVKVSVDDGPAEEFAADGTLTMAEGHHRLRLAGAVDEAHEVDLRSDVFGRWFSKPIWVLNPGGDATFDRMTAFYAEDPPPSQHDPVVGRPFIAVPHVDYAFQDPPSSLSAEKRSGPIEKIAFQRLTLPDNQAFSLRLASDREGALKMAERSLRRQPADLSMLDAYAESLATVDPARAEAFLRTGLDRRPVAVEWHRAYQAFAEMARPLAELLSRYDGFLAAAPGDARLMYLRGRIEPDEARTLEFFQRSIEADPGLSWPWLGMGVRAGARANWAESIRCLRKAKELDADDKVLDEPLHVARLGAGQGSDMVEEYRQALKARPDDLEALMFACDALAASGRGGEIDDEIRRALDRLPGPDRSQVTPLIRPVGLYMAGKPDRAAGEARLGRPIGDSILMQSLLAIGQSIEVAEDKALDRFGDDPWNALAVGLGLALDGHAELADRWRERGVARLATLSLDHRAAAKILRSAEPPPVADVIRLMIPSPAKALTFAVLAARFPGRAAEYAAEAARHNVRHSPPHELIRRVAPGRAAAP